jgi:hypothetical protein
MVVRTIEQSNIDTVSAFDWLALPGVTNEQKR